MTTSWIECKDVCRDCPNRTDRTAKPECLHIWRHLVEASLVQSGDGSVPSDILERLRGIGAIVSDKISPDGKRPSVQVYDSEPLRRFGFQKAVTKNN